MTGNYELVPALCSIIDREIPSGNADMVKTCITILYILSNEETGQVQLFRGQSVSTLLRIIGNEINRKQS